MAWFAGVGDADPQREQDKAEVHKAHGNKKPVAARELVPGLRARRERQEGNIARPTFPGTGLLQHPVFDVLLHAEVPEKVLHVGVEGVPLRSPHPFPGRRGDHLLP